MSCRSWSKKGVVRVRVEFDVQKNFPCRKNRVNPMELSNVPILENSRSKYSHIKRFHVMNHNNFKKVTKIGSFESKLDFAQRK